MSSRGKCWMRAFAMAILPFQAADYCGPVIREMWQQLERCGYFEVRRRNNPYSLENFEFLYDGAMDGMTTTIHHFGRAAARCASRTALKTRSGSVCVKRRVREQGRFPPLFRSDVSYAIASPIVLLL